jgi:hypothetical protein
MARPVEDQVRVRIVEEEKEIKTTKGKQGKPKAGQKGRKEGDGDSAPTHGLPPYALLTKNGRLVGAQETRPWPEGFTEQDGGIIEDLGKDGLLYKINYDNASHIRYRLGARGDISRDVVTEKYILGMRILMLGYEHALRILKETKNGEANGIAEFQDEFRRMAARGAASTVLALAENLPKIVDRSAETSAQDIEWVATFATGTALCVTLASRDSLPERLRETENPPQASAWRPAVPAAGIAPPLWGLAGQPSRFRQRSFRDADQQSFLPAVVEWAIGFCIPGDEGYNGATFKDDRLTAPDEPPFPIYQAELEGALTFKAVQAIVALLVQHERAVRVADRVAKHGKEIPAHVRYACSALIPTNDAMCPDAGVGLPGERLFLDICDHGRLWGWHERRRRFRSPEFTDPLIIHLGDFPETAQRADVLQSPGHNELHGTAI